jgi:hypothetical protein
MPRGLGAIGMRVDGLHYPDRKHQQHAKHGGGPHDHTPMCPLPLHEVLWFGFLILNLDDHPDTEDAWNCVSPHTRRLTFHPAGWSVGQDRDGKQLL